MRLDVTHSNMQREPQPLKLRTRQLAFQLLELTLVPERSFRGRGAVRGSSTDTEEITSLTLPGARALVVAEHR